MFFHLILKNHILPKYDESTPFFVNSIGIVIFKVTKVNKIVIKCLAPSLQWVPTLNLKLCLKVYFFFSNIFIKCNWKSSLPLPNIQSFKHTKQSFLKTKHILNSMGKAQFHCRNFCTNHKIIKSFKILDASKLVKLLQSLYFLALTA